VPLVSHNTMYLLAAAALNFSSQATAKKGLEGVTLSMTATGIMDLVVNPLILLSLVLQIAGMLVWFHVLSTTRLSIALPSLMALICLFTVFFDTVVLGHRISLTFLLGAALAVSGVYVLNKGA